MKSTFELAMRLLLRHEGGFVDHPKDPGGMTNLGVTQRTWEVHTGKDATEADMRALTPQGVQPIYKARYWNTIHGDDLPHGVDYCLFDCAVNSGPGRAVKLAQYVLHQKVDGILGKKTMAAILEADPVEFIEDYNQRRLDFLKSLPTWETFGKGWSKRVSEVELKAKVFARNSGAVA
jgi:lysozyme family protein